MIQNIQYSGINTATPDYDAPDGALDLSVNLLLNDGALRPVDPPATVMSLDPNFSWRVLTAFRPQGFSGGDPRHYIVLNVDNRSLSCIRHGQAFSHSYFDGFPDGIDILSAVTVGNTLIVLTSDGIRYYLWRDSKFRLIGSSLPEVPIGFGLKGHCTVSSYGPIAYPAGADHTPTSGNFDTDTRLSVTNTVLAAVNKFIADNSVNAGRFIFPFRIRYALRLYDGSLTHHSAPVLMRPAIGSNPVAFTAKDTQDHPGSYCYVMGVTSSLCFDILGDIASIRDDLNRWRDIVKSIDIFISAPIYTYDQGGDVERFAPAGSISLPIATCAPDSGPDTSRRFRPCSDIFDDNYNLPDDNRLYFDLPAFTDEQIADKVLSSPFYLLKSIPVDSLIALDDSQTSHPVDIPDDYLPALVAREVLPDDFNSHDILVPRYAFSYNQRLNLANISRRILPASDIRTFAQIMDGNSAYYVRAYIYIRRDGHNFILRTPEVLIRSDFSLPYIFHHCADAYRILLIRRKYSTPDDTSALEYCDINLTPDDFLTGASHLDAVDSSALRFHSIASLPDGIPPADSISPYAVADLSNRIYLSEVNNPFFFSPSSVCAVGTGTILAISSAARPLSEGQFGQFPLYAFTSEGIWALEVAATGAYSARQPIARDIVLSSDSVTQIDSAVLFASSRGIMMISGSQVSCISDPLNSDFPLDTDSLPGFDKLSSIHPVPFSQFLADARIIYDYAGSRIFVFNPSLPYAYVYSLKSHAWGMCTSALQQPVVCYPEAMALDHDCNLVSFSDPNPGSADVLYPAVLLTRPLKLQAPDVLKTIETVAQRGRFFYRHVNSVLYGSRDLINWSLIHSSKTHWLRGFSGTPYKYFRIALLCNLRPDECVSAASISFRHRLSNHIR